MRKRRRRKNPDTTSLLLLGGLAAGGYYLYKKSQQPKRFVTPGGAVVKVPTNPVTALLDAGKNWLTEKLSGVASSTTCSAAEDKFSQELVGGQGPPASGDDKVIAGGGCYILKESGRCYDTQGRVQPASKCAHLNAKLGAQLEGMNLGSLGSCGLGSLGNC